eukprot:TRINITY_DN12437_c0_g1_i1.p1 TRINITY_DN12437_c0_g1~~TRINITY_DN12437_c0_g1_i1.p1  ORF type:complete len:266 (+),score=22.84 TRINITY_DN12437_c0_g1_i1:195-992(+)
MFAVICSVLHSLLHLAISLYLLFCDFIRWLWIHRRSLFSRSSRTLVEFEQLHTLKKLPRHLGLMFDENTVQNEIDYVAQLVCWSIAADIRIITLYDTRGVIKNNKSQLEVAITKHKRTLDYVSKMNILIGREACIQALYPGGKYSYEFVCEIPANVAVVNIISDEDGKHQIIKLAKQYCASIRQKQLSINDISMDTISRHLPSTMGLPDPDLILKYDSSFAMAPFLPWHIRLTEIFQCGKIQHFDSESFRYNIRRFAGTEQRFGT